MAKKSKAQLTYEKLSKEYSRERANARKRIYRQRQKGYNVQLPESPLKGKKPTDYAKANRELRKAIAYLKSLTASEIRAVSQQQRQQVKSPKYGGKTYLPRQSNISLRNYVMQVGRFFLSVNEIKELINMIQSAPANPRYTEHPPRSGKPWIRLDAINASDSAVDKLLNLIYSLFSKEETISITEDKEKLMEALDKALFGYDEDTVNVGLNTAIAILSSKPLTAEEAKELDDYDDEEDY